ncbi:MAG: hypothetical protein ABMA64_14860 [Myxococcota bacterium]
MLVTANVSDFRELVAARSMRPPILLKSGMTDDAVQYLAGVRLLDAALNGHLDPAGVPVVFKGDTDLVYPPDMERFVTWLEEVIGDTLRFLSASIEVVRPQVAFVCRIDGAIPQGRGRPGRASARTLTIDAGLHATTASTSALSAG